MTEKGLVRRDETDRTHVYHAAADRGADAAAAVRDLLDRAFGGSASKLVMQALATKRATPRSWAKSGKLIDDSATGGTR